MGTRLCRDGEALTPGLFDMPDSMSFFLVWMFGSVITTFVHELGHAVFGNWAGYVVTSFGIGLGRPWLVIPVRGVRFYWGFVRPLQGITFAYPPRLFPTAASSIVYFAGGIVANLLTAAMFLTLWWFSSWGGIVCLAFGTLNGFVALVNLIPFHITVGKLPLRTDGALIVELVRLGAIQMPSATVAQTLTALRGLWLAIGDIATLRIYTLSAASAWLSLGDVERACERIEEEQCLPGPRSPYAAALLSLVRAELALKQGFPGEAPGWIDEAAAYFRRTEQLDELFVTEIVRGQAARACGGRFDDAELLALSGNEQVRNRRVLQAIWNADGLLAACGAGDPALVAGLLPRFENAARQWPSDCRDFGVYGEVAALFERTGNLQEADRAHERKLLALQNLALSWADPADRARFLSLHEPALESTRAYFEARGRPGDVAWFLKVTGERAPVVSAEQRDFKLRRLARWGFWINFLLMLCSFAVAIVIDPETVRTIILIPFGFAFFIVLSVVYRLFDFTIARWIPPLKRAGGAVLLMLACAPWLMVLCVGIDMIIRS